MLLGLEFSKNIFYTAPPPLPPKMCLLWKDQIFYTNLEIKQSKECHVWPGMQVSETNSIREKVWAMGQGNIKIRLYDSAP